MPSEVLRMDFFEKNEPSNTRTEKLVGPLPLDRGRQAWGPAEAQLSVADCVWFSANA